ncbi:MAG TPA: hypothetical protein VGN88_10395 [Phycisphaerae bacterium]|jgi:predicted metal-dependent HD superfamily phosphohydrolase
MPDSLDSRLLAFWQPIWPVGAAVPPLNPLLARYDEPHRFYHNARHIRECLAQLAAVLPIDRWQINQSLPLALFYHDAIYDPRAADNEARSAELAQIHLQSLVPPATLQDIVRLILATDHKRPPTVPDESTMIDIDLSILGQEPALFEEYEAAIRHEYSHVSVEAFRKGRSAVLRNFLARPKIYSTEFFHRQYESTARVNLSNSLDRLAAPLPHNSPVS